MLWKIAPVALIVIGALGALGCIMQLAEGRPDAPTEVDISDLESGEASPGDWIQVEDAKLLTACVYFETSQGKDGSEQRDAAYVPLLAADTAAQFVNGRVSGRTHCGFVRFEMDELMKKFPAFEKEDQFPERNLHSFAISGIVEAPGTIAISRKLKEEIKKLGFEKALILKPGTEPPTAGESAGGAALSLVALSGGIYWLRRRRRGNDPSQRIG